MHQINFKPVEKEVTISNNKHDNYKQTCYQSMYLQLKADMYMKLAHFNLSQSQINTKANLIENLALSTRNDYHNNKYMFESPKKGNQYRTKQKEKFNYLRDKLQDNDLFDSQSDKQYQQQREYQKYLMNNLEQIKNKIEQPLTLSLCEEDTIQFNINLLDFLFQSQKQNIYEIYDAILQKAIKVDKKVRIERNLMINNQRRKKQLQNAAIFNGQIIKDLNKFSKFIKMETIDIDVINTMIDNIMQYPSLKELFLKDKQQFINELNDISRMYKINCKIPSLQGNTNLTQRELVQQMKSKQINTCKQFTFNNNKNQTKYLIEFQRSLKQIVTKTFFMLISQCDNLQLTQNNFHACVNQIKQLLRFVAKKFSTIQVFYNDNKYMVTTQKQAYVFNQKKSPYRFILDSKEERQQIQQFISKSSQQSAQGTNSSNILQDLTSLLSINYNLNQFQQDDSFNFDIMDDQQISSKTVPENTNQVYKKKMEISSQITHKLQQSVIQEHPADLLENNNFDVLQSQYAISQKEMQNNLNMEKEHQSKENQPQNIQIIQDNTQNEHINTQQERDESTYDILQSSKLSDKHPQKHQHQNNQINNQILDISHIKVNSNAEQSDESILSVEQIDQALDKSELPSYQNKLNDEKSKYSLLENDKPLTQEQTNQAISDLQKLLHNSQIMQKQVNNSQQNTSQQQTEQYTLNQVSNNSVVNMYSLSQSKQNETKDDVQKSKKKRAKKENKQKTKSTFRSQK